MLDSALLFFRLMMQRKILPVILLMTVLTPVHAKWIMLDSASKAGGIHYYDPQTIQKNDHLLKTWVLSNYDEKRIGEYRSVKALYEFDCRQEKVRSQTMLLYSGEMASGNVVGAHHEEATDWFSYPSHSMFNFISVIICEK